MFLSIIIPTHNPHPARLRRTLAGLAGQTWPADQREVIVVDNASAEPLRSEAWTAGCAGLRIVREDQLGLTAARLRGLAAARGELLVLVDDDNVLSSGYLAAAAAIFAADPPLGAAGGRSLPEFETPPPAWAREFDGLLALRDPGPAPGRARWAPDEPRSYPECAPIGAGMVLRHEAAAAYAAALRLHPERRELDRTGARLISGGDNDLVMAVLEGGWAVAYRPELSLVHLIPARRSEPAYLGELNRAIARSWVRVLALHGIRPWRPVSPGTVRLRQARAWLRAKAWRGPAEWIRWQGRCGTFEGQADLTTFSS